MRRIKVIGSQGSWLGVNWWIDGQMYRIFFYWSLAMRRMRIRRHVRMQSGSAVMCCPRSHDELRMIAINRQQKQCSKRKIGEIEESEKIEKTAQNRIKLLKKEEKKGNSMSKAVSNQKQASGSLLNYFSKAPAGLTHTNTTNLSTIVVKADVHVNNKNVNHNLNKCKSSNGICQSRKSRKSRNSDTDLSHVDDIHVIESENINASNSKNKLEDEVHLNKRRWSLRIKMQTTENGIGSLGESSDEEIFSSRSRLKLNTQNSIRSSISSSTESENLQTKNKTKKEISKQINTRTKLQSKKQAQLENTKDIIIVEDDSDSENKLKTAPELLNINKRNSIAKESEKLNNNDNMKLSNITTNKVYQHGCMYIGDNSKRKTADKLAPLFTKRRKPDPEVLAARRLFLQPDVTENNNKNTSRKIHTCNILAFPLISHITQVNDTLYNKNNTFNIPKEIYNNYIPTVNVTDFKYLMESSKTKIEPLEVNKPKVQEALSDIEKRCSNAKEMWEIISCTLGAQPRKIVSPKRRIKRTKKLEETEPAEYKNKEEQLKWSSWTLKFQPKSTQEIVGNEEAASKLRKWLLGWKATFTNECLSSGDEFCSSDSNHSKIVENNQVAVLIGPHGCGKTASVYAVAEEFGYTVLELNASSRRTGKKILKELEEATKSHRIKKNEKVSTLSGSISDEIKPKKIPENSLILIDDVDIIFEEDEGFVSATYQLVLNTKRPIVMTCRDVCPHLNRMAPQQNKIHFQHAVGTRVSALLELISLAVTGYSLPSNCITELLQSGDLRKAILQLQYLLLSGPPQRTERSINFKNAFWQNIRYFLYKPAIRESRKRKKKKTANIEVRNYRDIITDVANKLDSIALISSLINVEDSALNMWQIKTHPDLSLIESTTPYSASTNVCLEIAEWIGNKTMHEDQLSKHDAIQRQSTIMLTKQLNKGVNLALSQTTSLLLDQHVLATDYLSSVRNICRAEESRATANNKRRNRFFHYLHNLKASSTLLRPNILAAACKMMNDSL